MSCALPLQLAGRELAARLWRWWRARRILHVVLAAAVLYGVVLERWADRAGGNLSVFICLGDRFVPPGFPTEGLVVLPKSDGYDGQFFFYIAHDPWMRTALADRMDSPPYRYQRILYPLTALVLAGGRSGLLPAALLAVNLLAVLAGTALVARLLLARRASAWLALFYPAVSGLLMATLLDLSEPLMTALLVAALVAWLEERPWTASTLLAAAALAREVALAVVPAIILTECLRRRWRRALVGAAALIPVAAWQVAVTLRFGVHPWRAAESSFAPPFTAVLDYARRVLVAPERWAEATFFVLTTGACALAGLLALRAVGQRRDAVALAFAGYAVLPFLLSRHVWVEPWAYGRAVIPVAVLTLVEYARSGDRLLLPPLALHAAAVPFFLLWAHIL